jgi:hypothetical protein
MAQAITPTVAPYQQNQTENQMAAVDKEIQRLQGFSDMGGIQNVANARDVAREIGEDPYSLLGIEHSALDQVKGGAWEGGVLEGDPGQGGSRGEFLRSSQFVDKHRAALSNRLQEKIRGLTQQRNSLKEKAINDHLASAKAKEGVLQQSLGDLQEQYLAQIDSQLNESLKDTGLNAAQARQVAGSNFADRGLGRSSFAQTGLGHVTQAEQEQKAGLRSEAYQGATGLKQGIQGTVDKIAQQREKLSAARDLSELQSFEQAGFDIDVNQLHDKFNNELANMQLDAKSQEYFAQLVGGFAKAGAMALTL